MKETIDEFSEWLNYEEALAEQAQFRRLFNADASKSEKDLAEIRETIRKWGHTLIVEMVEVFDAASGEIGLFARALEEFYQYEKEKRKNVD